MSFSAPAMETSSVREPADLERVPCNLCGGSDFSVVYRDCPDRLYWLPGKFDVVRCRQCGLAQTNPRPTRATVGRYYPDSYHRGARCRGPGAPRRVRRTLHALVRLPYACRYGRVVDAPPPEDGRRLLDVGCGSGEYLARMWELGWEPWGIEPDPAAASAAARELGLPEGRILCGPAEEADFPQAGFDLVTMSHVVEHLHDPKGVLRKIQTCLRPGGTLRLWTPNFASFESRLMGRFWTGLDIPRHLYHFSPVTLGALLESTGFRIERVVPEFQTGSLSGSVYLAARALLRRRGPCWTPRPLYYALMPLGSILLALGNAAALDVTARKRP